MRVTQEATDHRAQTTDYRAQGTGLGDGLGGWRRNAVLGTLINRLFVMTNQLQDSIGIRYHISIRYDKVNFLLTNGTR